MKTSNRTLLTRFCATSVVTMFIFFGSNLAMAADCSGHCTELHRVNHNASCPIGTECKCSGVGGDAMWSCQD